VSAPGDGGASGSGSAPEERSSWRPFVLAFIVGAVVLTLLPLLQERFLKAPPPVLQLEPWTAGEGVSSAALAGTVVLLTVELMPCEAECAERVRSFGAITQHVSDLAGREGVSPIVLVTLADEPTRAALQGVLAPSEAWRVAPPEPRLMTQLQIGLAKFLGADSTDFSRSHALVLLDQNGAVRGYWQGDVAGRGNAINAARLLAKKGPNP
jgi:hypothetical protein